MTQEEYLKRFEMELNELGKITNRKNRDYAGPDDAFANFRMIQELTQGRISLEHGIIVRMTDKLARIINLLQNAAQVKSETIADTLRDLAVYSLILKLYLDSKLENEVKDDRPPSDRPFPPFSKREKHS